MYEKSCKPLFVVNMRVTIGLVWLCLSMTTSFWCSSGPQNSIPLIPALLLKDSNSIIQYISFVSVLFSTFLSSWVFAWQWVEGWGAGSWKVQGLWVKVTDNVTMPLSSKTAEGSIPSTNVDFWTLKVGMIRIISESRKPGDEKIQQTKHKKQGEESLSNWLFRVHLKPHTIPK